MFLRCREKEWWCFCNARNWTVSSKFIWTDFAGLSCQSGLMQLSPSHPLPPRCQCNIFDFPLTTDISNIPNISNMNFNATFLSHPLPRCQCNIFVFIPLKRHWQQIHQIHLSNDSGHIRNHSIHCVSGHFIRELKSYEK